MPDLSTCVMAKALGLGATLYYDLPIGALFRLGATVEVYRKARRGYRQADGTGRRTAVFTGDKN